MTTTGGMTAARITTKAIRPAMILDRRDLRQPRELTCFSMSAVDMVDKGRTGWN